ncbi:F0F1 ATP synthase subunit delta [Brachymonas sp. G13]|uniref:F0F1 ATP synthase subunit delta n=1 Tax=Brachymonas TaxID=28219 RepID=UPI0016A5239E|nr:F0F1 ATP synthase subunit delta [Brachymonas sp. J145]MEE1654411.1 F0F1 ATP synthase subunit delta [Brachymonas sp. J145]NLX16105.1 F0F1 ATP synthase subunit delta [Ramlibacter sp.]
MAELATIARPYAQALFDASAGKLDETAQWVGQLAAVAGNAELLQVADSPKVQGSQLFELIAGLLPAALPEAGKNFLRLVVDNGRLAALPEIASQFESLKNAATGAADAVIYSAFPMEGAELADLMALLEKRFGTRLQPTVVVDQELIGGVRVVVGDEVLDTSVKARIEQMKQALTA